MQENYGQLLAAVRLRPCDITIFLPRGRRLHTRRDARDGVFAFYNIYLGLRAAVVGLDFIVAGRELLSLDPDRVTQMYCSLLRTLTALSESGSSKQQRNCHYD